MTYKYKTYSKGITFEKSKISKELYETLSKVFLNLQEETDLRNRIMFKMIYELPFDPKEEQYMKELRRRGRDLSTDLVD